LLGLQAMVCRQNAITTTTIEIPNKKTPTL
jgi:hypothetical protein